MADGLRASGAARDRPLGRREQNFFSFPSWLPHFLVGVFTRGPRAFKERAERLLEQELDHNKVGKGRKKNPAAH